MRDPIFWLAAVAATQLDFLCDQRTTHPTPPCSARLTSVRNCCRCLPARDFCRIESDLVVIDISTEKLHVR